MSSIDKRIVEMQFDNQQFERGIQTSIKSLDSLKKGLDLDSSAKSLTELEKAGRHFSLNGIGTAVDTIANRFSTLGIIGVTALQNITNSAINAGKQMLESLTIAPITQGFNEYELKMGSIQTIMASTGADLQTVSAYLEELNEYADKTIYSFSDMTTNIGKFTNAGVDLDSAVKAIQGISNVAAVSGANANEASRAMYNFSQALSAGYVKLIDWKSIENANMATVEFKQQLIDSAVAAGTLTKMSNGMYKTLKGNTLNATKNFNETLQDQWMTSEVLITTLGRYSDETTDIGKKAFAAAQDVKTFTQLMDTLKEAVGSGWAMTFENIFGNFEEAKKLWTGVSNVIGGMIEKSSEARNSVLADWKEMGGRDAIIEGLAAAFDGLYGIVLAVKEALEEIFPPVTAEQLVNFSNKVKEAGENLKAFFSYATGHQYKRGEKLIDTSATINELDKLDKVLRRGASGDSVRKMQEYLKQLGYDVGEIDGIFGPKTEAALKAFQEEHNLIVDGILGKNTIQSLGEALGLADTQSEFEMVDEEVTVLGSTLQSLKAIAQGAFSTFKMGITIFKFLFGVVTRIAGVFSPVVSMLFKMAEAAGRFMTALNEKVSGSNKFTEWLEKLDKLLGPVKEYIDKACQSFLDFLGIGGDLSKIDFGKVIDDLIAKFKEFFGVTEDGTISLDGLDFDATSFVEKVKAKITSAIQSLKDWIVGFTKRSGDETAKDVQSAGGFSGFTVFGVGLAVGLAAIGSSIFKTISQFAKIGKNINKVLSSVNGVIKGTLLKQKGSTFESVAEGIKSFAIAIGILAAAVYVLSKLKLSELGTGLLGVAGIIGLLVASIIVLSKTTKDFKNVKRITDFLLTFAASVAILGVVVYGLSTLSPEQLGKGLLGLAGILAAVIVAMFAFSKITKNTESLGGVIGLIATLAGSLMAMADVVDKIGQMENDTLIRGFIGMSAVMVAIALFIKSLSKVKVNPSTILALIPMALAIDLLILGFVGLTMAMKAASVSDIVKAIVGIGVIVLAVESLMKKMGKFKPNVTSVLALIPVAVALDALILGFIALTMAMKVATIGDMVKSIVGIGTILIAVKSLMKTMSKVKPNIGAILALIPVAVALDALILGFIALTLVMRLASFGDMVKALVSFGTVMIALSLFMKSLGKAKPSIGSILGIIPIVAALDILLAGFIALLFAVKGATFGDLIKAIAGMGAVMLSLSIFMKSLKKLSLKSAISSLIGCIGIVAVMITFSYALSKIKDIPSDKVLSFAGGLSAILVAMGALFALSGVGGLAGVGTALVGILGVVAVVSAIIAAFAGLSKIPGFQDFMNSGAASIGEIIGNFIGSMQGAIQASSVKTLSKGLSELKDVSIDEGALDTVLAAAQKISHFANALPAKPNLTKVTDFFFGSELEQFSRSMVTFGVCARSLMFSLSGIEWDSTLLDPPLAMAQSLKTFEDSLPEKNNAEKIVDFFFGSKLEQFAKGMATFGTYAKELATTMEDVEFDEGMLDAPLAVAQSLATFENSLPQTTTAEKIISFFFGDELDQFASGMVTFAEKSKAMSETMKDVEFDKTMLDAPIALAESLAAFESSLPENSTAESIINFFFGSELEQFAGGMLTFAQKSKAIASVMEGVEFDEKVMDAPIAYAKALASFADDLPENTVAETIIGFFFGDELTQFANGMLTFARKSKAIATVMQGVEFDKNMLNAPIEMAKAINSFSTENLPDKTTTETIVDFFFGDELTQFSGGMEEFARAAAAISTSMEGVELDQNAIDAAISIGNGLIDMQAKMPEKSVGQKISDFLLGSNLDSLIEEMPKLGEMAASLANSASSIENIDSVQTDTDKIIALCKSVAGLMSYLCSDEVNFQYYTNGYETPFTMLLGYVGQMGSTLVDFESSLGDINADRVISLITPIADISKAIATLSVLGEGQTVGIDNLEMSIGRIPGIISDLNDATVNTENVQKISQAISDISAMLNDPNFLTMSPESVTNFQEIMTGLQSIFSAEGINFDSTAFSEAGIELGEAIGTGISSVDLNDSIELVCNSALSAAEGYYDSFYDVGWSMSSGMSSGLSDSAWIVEAAAARVASDALAAARRTLDSHSPSKEFVKLGRDSDVGFANGLDGYSKVVDASADKMASSMLNTAKSSLAILSTLISENMDADPVIRPVIDLSAVQAGIREINGIIPTGSSFFVGTSTEKASMISEGIKNSRMYQNGVNPINGMPTADQLREMNLGRGTNVLDFDKAKIVGGEDSKAVVSEIKTLTSRVDALNEAVTHMKVVLDNGALVGEISSQMDGQLGVLSMRRGRGN